MPRITTLFNSQEPQSAGVIEPVKYIGFASSGARGCYAAKLDGATATKITIPSAAQILTTYFGGIAFSPDGQLLAIAGDKTPYIGLYWIDRTTDVFTIFPNTAFTAASGPLRNITFSPNGQLVVCQGTVGADVYKVLGTGPSAVCLKVGTAFIGTAPGAGIGTIAFNKSGTIVLFPYTGRYYSPNYTTGQLTYLGSIGANQGVAADGNNDFLVALGSDNTNADVRRFLASGTPGSEILLDDATMPQRNSEATAIGSSPLGTLFAHNDWQSWDVGPNRMFVRRRSDGTLILQTNIYTYDASNVSNNLAFSRDGKYVGAPPGYRAENNGAKVYLIDGETLTNVPMPASNVAGNVEAIAFG